MYVMYILSYFNILSLNLKMKSSNALSAKTHKKAT